MKLGIMQPYFFPYIGYFSLIANTDRFILFDPVQFITHGWIERNRVLKPQEGWQYISVALQKHHQKTCIADIKINHKIDWRGRILRQIEHYKKRAPYYAEVVQVFQDAVNIETESITKLNEYALKTVCKYLSIETPIEIFSEMDLQIGEVSSADEWALEICRAVPEADSYLNPEGGLAFFDRDKYDQAGIHIDFQKMNLQEYSQRRKAFEPGLSIIDVMMFNPPAKIHEMLEDFELL